MTDVLNNNRRGTIQSGVVTGDHIQDGVITSDHLSANLNSAIGGRNVIINGNFDVWQRATSQTSSGFGSDDRWHNSHDKSSKTASRQSFALGQTDVPNNPKYYSRTVVTSSADSVAVVLKKQRIEDVTIFSGQTITLSFWAKADAAKDIATEFVQHFGTTGSPSATVNAMNVTTHSLTTSWAKYTVTFTVTSVSGKTLGTDGNDRLELNFWFDAGSTFDSRTNTLGQQSGTYDIAQVQIEQGSVATNFERRSIGEELALCQRYYNRIDAKSGMGISLTIATGVTSALVDFPLVTNIRAVPTITYQDLKLGGGTVTDFNTIYGSANHVSATVVRSASGLTVGDPYHLRGYTASSYVAVDAEL